MGISLTGVKGTNGDPLEGNRGGGGRGRERNEDEVQFDTTLHYRPPSWLLSDEPLMF